ncbi:hypothetical protein BGCPKDLD_4675 [Methylorubrum suomiense]|uniref:Uncharacterized protein n=1 Tax=Methylorubrum suomiense TaxID=144191 RepID=A0ABQ4V1U2_9HYPH|nr:hypothetical protein BGCPKDLD_4675 [Methylorubrum suomiense]
MCRIIFPITTVWLLAWLAFAEWLAPGIAGQF